MHRQHGLRDARTCVHNQCEECITNADCVLAQGTCVHNRCEACTSNADCTTQRCDPSNGFCMSSSFVTYVNHDITCRDETHDATAQDPYCEIAPAIAWNPMTIIQVAASQVAYAPIKLGRPCS